MILSGLAVVVAAGDGIELGHQRVVIAAWFGLLVAPPVMTVLAVFVLPWLDRSPVRSGTFRPVFKWFFWLLVFDVVILMFCGKYPPESYWMPFGLEIVDADVLAA